MGAEVVVVSPETYKGLHSVDQVQQELDRMNFLGMISQVDQSTPAGMVTVPLKNNVTSKIWLVSNY